MSTNIEIKARLTNLDKTTRLAQALSDMPGQLITQQDTFFHIPHGRLKLRVLAANQGELIYYEREDKIGPKQSNYLIYRTTDPATLTTVLSAALGVRGMVRKKRWLYLVGQTRIHLDKVDGLGDFLELEVVLGPDDDPALGQVIATELMAKLGVAQADLIEGAYIDLLENAGRV